MAVEAPLHQQRVRLEHQWHLIHRTMASRAADALAYVNAVIEIRKIPEPVNFHPLDRLISAIAFANWFKVTGIIEENRMAIHAGFGGRYACGCGSFH